MSPCPNASRTASADEFADRSKRFTSQFTERWLDTHIVTNICKKLTREVPELIVALCDKSTFFAGEGMGYIKSPHEHKEGRRGSVHPYRRSTAPKNSRFVSTNPFSVKCSAESQLEAPAFWAIVLARSCLGVFRERMASSSSVCSFLRLDRISALDALLSSLSDGGNSICRATIELTWSK